MHDPGPARRKCGVVSKSAGARGGSDAPSHKTRRSTLRREEKGEKEERDKGVKNGVVDARVKQGEIRKERITSISFMENNCF